MYTVVILSLFMAFPYQLFAEPIFTTKQRTKDAASQVRAKVDLESQYPEKIDIQKGNSCHVYASAALFEAACFRKTGKRIDIDEEKLFAKHLHENVKNFNLYSPEREYRRLRDSQAGFPTDTLNRIAQGEVCEQTIILGNAFDDVVKVMEHYSEKYLQLPYSASYEVRRINGRTEIFPKPESDAELGYAKLFLLKAYHKEQTRNYEDLHSKYLLADTLSYLLTFSKRNEIKQQIDFHLKKYTEVSLAMKDYEKQFNWKEMKSKKIESDFVKDVEKIESTEGFQSQDLRDCLNSRFILETKMAPSMKEVVSILDKKIPVLCSSLFTDRNGNEGWHAFNILAYRTNPAFSNNVEFKIRDSNFPVATWGWEIKGCERVDIIK